MNRNVLLLLLLAACWSPSFLFIKIGLASVPPFTLTAMRVALGGLLLYVMLVARGRALPRDWKTWKLFLFMGFFANALPFSLFSFGELHAESGAAAVINGTTPLFTVVLAHLFIAEERLDTRALAGVVVGFAGVAVMFYPQIVGLVRGGGGAGTLLGLGAFAAAACSYGVSIVHSRRHLRGLPPNVAPAAQLLCATALLAPLAVLERPWEADMSAGSLAAVGALAVLGTAVAYRVYYRLIETASATFVSLVTYIMPPAGVVLGIVFLAERPGWEAAAGCALILGGVMLVNFARRSNRPS